jgi:hypothetical protein
MGLRQSCEIRRMPGVRTSKWRDPLATIAFVTLTVAVPWTQPQRSSDILVDEPFRLESQLNSLGKRGLRVDAVALPEAPFLPRVVAIVLSPHVGGAAEAVAYRVISDARLPRVEDDVNARAREGYRLKGLTIVSGGLTRDGVEFVAIVERAEPPQAGGVKEYRFVRTLGNSREWKQFQDAGRLGFDVIEVIARPDPRQMAAGDVTFICEKRADGAATSFETVVSSDVSRTERDVNALAAKGFEVRAMWAGTAMINTLLSRPAATASGSRTYDIDGDPLTVPSVSSSSGRLVAWSRFKGEQIPAYERGASGAYEMVTDPVPEQISYRSELVERARDRIDRVVRKGLRPVWARIWKDERGQAMLSTILSRG